MGFNRNVFINCPFDPDFFVLLKPLLYAIKIIGFNPRISLERFDSGEVRLDKIKELIESSKYSIHDFSKIKSTYLGEYFRLNMPFELGIDIGCKQYHPNRKFRSKKILVLEGELYSVKKALSDLPADCKCHDNDSEKLVKQIRNWFVELGLATVPPATKIWNDYNIFYSNLHKGKKHLGYTKKDIDELPIREFINFMDD